METIKVYLDNMFLNIPDSEQVRRVKAELYEMMEDKYHELMGMGKPENEAVGIVISEFGNLEELKEELGLEKAPADSPAQQGFRFQEKELFQDEFQETQETTKNERRKREKKAGHAGRMLSFDEVEDYLQGIPRVAAGIGLGVMFCICSPAMLIMLSEGGNAGIAIGLTLLFVLVAAGVALFILASMKEKRFAYLKQDIFRLDQETEQFVRDEKEAGRQWFIWQLVAGVGLCILCPVPLMVSGILNLPEHIILIAVGLLLVLVGVGCFLIVRACIQQDMYKVLLQEEGYTREKKSKRGRMKLIDSLYWPVVLVIYLMCSFNRGYWGKTWIIWIIAGVFYSFLEKIWKQKA